MKHLYFLIITVICLHSCQRQVFPVPKRFSLSGKTDKLPDGTMIYIVDVLSNRLLDSVPVKNHSFFWKAELPVLPVHLFLHTGDYAQIKSLWVENRPVVFDASRSGFEGAVITGSKLQSQLEAFLTRTANIESEQQQEEEAIKFIRQYPGSRVSASMLAGYAPNWGKQKTRELYETLSESNKTSVYGQQVKRFIALHREHQPGAYFTDFAMTDLQGDTLRLSQHLGRITLLEFWASWCGPCRAQNPELVKIYDKYKNAGFDIFAVSLDFSGEDWQRAIKKDDLRWHHVSDLKGRNSTAGMIYGINTIPDNYLIDPDGLIVARSVWGEQLEAAIEQVLAKPKKD